MSNSWNSKLSTDVKYFNNIKYLSNIYKITALVWTDSTWPDQTSMKPVQYVAPTSSANPTSYNKKQGLQRHGLPLPFPPRTYTSDDRWSRLTEAAPAIIQTPRPRQKLEKYHNIDAIHSIWPDQCSNVHAACTTCRTHHLCKPNPLQ